MKKCNNCGRRIRRGEEYWNGWDEVANHRIYICDECASASRPFRHSYHSSCPSFRVLFLLCCAFIVALATGALIWASQQGPPHEYYSFTNIRAELWHKVVCLPVLFVIAVATVLNTLKKLGDG